VAVDPEQLRSLLSRYPSGVCVVTVVADAQKLGLTIGSFASLSLEPPLVGFAVAKEAAMHELLREAGGCAISILAAGQASLAQHFARGVPPIAMWHKISTDDGANGAPLLVGALGWLECVVSQEVSAGSHTFFVCEVRRVELGEDAPALVRVRGEYRSV
jgi:flavin reductase (DIM6/NTAB) family NADH-FMN oxidoreductase RutF